MNQQADNFTSEIQKLESRIDAEIKAGRELRKIQMEQRAKEEEEGATAEAKRAEDKVLKGTRQLHLCPKFYSFFRKYNIVLWSP